MIIANVSISAPIFVFTEEIESEYKFVTLLPWFQQLDRDSLLSSYSTAFRLCNLDRWPWRGSASAVLQLRRCSAGRNTAGEQVEKGTTHSGSRRSLRGASCRCRRALHSEVVDATLKMVFTFMQFRNSSWLLHFMSVHTDRSEELKEVIDCLELSLSNTVNILADRLLHEL